ncbi:MAG: ATP synthase subunit b [Parcubacteria group bacterium GW2011_GWA2_42_18]|nr:MAG: ATP synthase subunit b [Parcubacteria group bacterium GW2011_GWA2_42_18]
MESLVSTFHIDVKLLIAQLVNFAVVFGVLYWFALRPLAKLMRERSEKIEKGLNDAKENAKKLEEAKEEYKKIVSQARVEAERTLQMARKDAETARATGAVQAKEEIERLFSQGKKQLESEKNNMIEEARKEVADLVVRTVEKVLPSSISPIIDSEIIRSQVEKINA